MKKGIFRIIDANFNRSREGLRVCEDISRFMLNSPSITGELKSVRHTISGIMARSFTRNSKNIFFEYRNVRADVGRSVKLQAEMRRRDYRDIFTANIERVKESLRVLEEFFKLVDRKTSAKFTVLRFDVYDIEKKAIKRIESSSNLGRLHR